jgi:hypothetical protein
MECDGPGDLEREVLARKGPGSAGWRLRGGLSDTDEETQDHE